MCMTTKVWSLLALMRALISNFENWFFGDGQLLSQVLWLRSSWFPVIFASVEEGNGVHLDDSSLNVGKLKIFSLWILSSLELFVEQEFTLLWDMGDWFSLTTAVWLLTICGSLTRQCLLVFISSLVGLMPRLQYGRLKNQRAQRADLALDSAMTGCSKAIRMACGCVFRFTARNTFAPASEWSWF